MQNTKLIKKISTSLVSTGEIIDSLQSNSSTNAPSIRAVVDNMAPPMNLLINGDFKINQRGKSSYEINNSTWNYSIDLWRINGMKLQINSDKTITLTSLNETNYFQQIVENANYQTGDKLVLSLYIDGSIKVFNIQIGTIDYVDEKISIFASYNEEQKKLYLSLSLNQKSNSITLKWIRLNEGSIAYPHVVEDDAIALMRCQKKIKVFDEGILSVGSCLTAARIITVLEIDMDELPTMVASAGYLSANVQGIVAVATSISLQSNSNKNCVGVALEFGSNKFTAAQSGLVFVKSGRKLIFSCEPI